MEMIIPLTFFLFLFEDADLLHKKKEKEKKMLLYRISWEVR